MVRGRHERPLVQERQHLGVDVLALFLPGRGEDQRPVQQRPGGRVHERPRVDVVQHDGVRVPDPVQQRVSLDRVVLQTVPAVGDEQRVVPVVPAHGVHERVPARARAPPAGQKQRAPDGRVPHAVHNLLDPRQEPLVVPRACAGHASARSPRPTSACLASPSASASSADAGIASRPSAVPRRWRSGPAAARALRAAGGRRRAALDRLARQHSVRHQVDECGRLPHRAGQVGDRGPPSGPTSRRSSAPENARIGAALSPPLREGAVPGGALVAVRHRGVAGDASLAASGHRAAVPGLGDGLRERGDPVLQRGARLRLQHVGGLGRRGIRRARLGLEREEALAQQLRGQIELREGLLRVQHAHGGVRAHGDAPARLAHARGRIAVAVAERRERAPPRTRGGGDQEEVSPVPVLAAAERVRARLFAEPPRAQHLLPRLLRGRHGGATVL